jgi:hypothetical protein
MANAFTKIKFSGSTDGKPIAVAATGSPGTTIHTAAATTEANSYDEIWLYATNVSGADAELTIEFGDTAAGSVSKYTVLTKDGWKCVVPGFILQNSAVVKAYGAASTFNITGWVNRITHS